ncbi:metallophosphoesterase family protein [Thermodesulfobacteriota bacterium]
MENATRIGVISDTHLTGERGETRGLVGRLKGGSRPEGIAGLREDLAPHFDGVDLIIHSGDIVSLEVLGMLSDFARVEAVAGNMDPPALRESLPESRTLAFGRFRIGIVHGWGSPLGITNRIRTLFDEVDCIVFGHTHRPLNEVDEGILFFNPGSATDRAFAPHRSVGIVEVGRKIEGKIVRL